MVATARWMYRSALARTETRGMHKRDDFPALDPRSSTGSSAAASTRSGPAVEHARLGRIPGCRRAVGWR